MKKILTALTLILILALSLSLFACNTLNTVSEVQTEEDVYAFSAASSGALLAQYLTGAEATASEDAADETTTDETTEDIDTVNDYLGVVENLANPVTMTEEESDREDYAYKMTISVTDLEGNVTTFVMYYNETVITDEDPAAEDDTTDDVTAVEEETETAEPETELTEEDETAAIESYIDGILIVGEDEYTVRGVKVLNGENFKIKFMAKLDNSNYVMIKQKYENGEEKYMYRIVVNGVTVSETEMRFEGGAQRRIRIKMKNGEEFCFEHQNENGENCINVEKTSDGVTMRQYKVSVMQDETTGEQVYRYEYTENGKSGEKTRARFQIRNSEQNQNRNEEQNGAND